MGEACEPCAEEGSAKRSERTTLSLSLTVEDKRTLKLLAAERGTTVAAIIHEWVQEYARKDE
jgi:predicted DNA-binding protein